MATINSGSGAITAVSAGTSVTTYTVSGTGGCSDATANRTVTVTAAPNAGTLSGTEDVCSGSTTTFSSDGDAGGAWSSATTGVATINSGNGLITGVSSGTSVMTYTVSGTGGCSDATANRTATVSGAPSTPGSITGSSSVCSGIAGSYSISSVTGATSYTWAYSGTGTASSSTTSVDLTTTGAGNLTVTATNSCGTSSAQSKAITIATPTKYVSTTGSNSNNGDASNSAYLTLEYALTQVAGSGCYNISIAAGTYTDDLLDVTSSHDGITIVGAGIASTIFDQSGSGDHFMEIKSSATNITIKDLKIKDYDEQGDGGALDITTSGSVTIENVHFDGNSTTKYYSSGYQGSAIYTVNATTTIKKCVFSNNTTPSSTSNVSIVYTEGGMTMENCLFYDNSASTSTYCGIVSIDDGTNTITNCTFTENTGGDVVYIWDGNTTYIRNCLFCNNTGSYDVE